GDLARTLQVLEEILTQGAVVADLLDLKKPPVGREADAAQFGQVVQQSAEAEIMRVIDGRFGPQAMPLLVVLLDARTLVVHVQRGRDALGNHPGTEPPRGAPADAAI